MLLAAIVFLIPMISADNTDSIPKVAAILLFVIGPLGEIVGNAPLLAKCNIAIFNIKATEQDLDDFDHREKELLEQYDNVQKKKDISFEQLKVDGLEFSYVDSEGNKVFHLGPINFEMKKGEIVFLIGGNGSGKSTFLKLLTGLYNADQGEITINDKKLNGANLIDYRNMYSTIFTDFHLFKELYGVDDPDEDDIEKLLDMMELSERSQIVNGQITDINLSTGQKKRMALITAMLEQKQIYIFDEWAADQDPDFRKYFYTIILPKMKSEGKTILAATHDDRYFQYADHIIKLDAGSLDPYEHTPASMADNLDNSENVI
jgi:putative ATP-binding cassette transporter